MAECAHKRRSERLTSVLLVASAGACLALLPRLATLAPTPGPEDTAWQLIDVSGQAPGELRQWGRVAVYRRNAADMDEIDAFDEHLADPRSLLARQPPAARNPWRSTAAEYFVFLPQAPQRGCRVRSLSQYAPYRDWLGHLHRLPDHLPRYIDVCDGAVFDQSGRRVRGSGHPAEGNLVVPHVEWLSPTRALVRPSPPDNSRPG